MGIKMIAVDMDGTFLNSDKEYDRAHFQKLYEALKAQDIKFVVASGNQYYQLKSFFPDIEKEISFVAENGAYVISEGKEIFYGSIDRETVLSVLNILNQFDDAHTILCGRNSAYVAESEPESFIAHGRKYYHRLKKVPDLTKVEDDVLFKFALSFPLEQAEKALAQLQAVLGDKMVPVSSGHGDIDLIINGVHKANGLMRLQELWNINAEDIAAFGDSGNDFEMIKHVGYGFAMANAQPRIKDVAREIILSNDENGVLRKIESLLN